MRERKTSLGVTWSGERMARTGAAPACLAHPPMLP
jgi:hypothetical protein